MLDRVNRAICSAAALLALSFASCRDRALLGDPSASTPALPQKTRDAPLGTRFHPRPADVPVQPPRSPAPTIVAPAPDPFSSPSACEATLRSGRLPRPPASARIATWNIRWFPDGRPGRNAPGGGADLDWIACTLTWLDVDVAALQELKGDRRSRKTSERLLAALDSRTGGHWRLLRDSCDDAGSQQVGLLYDERRVKLESSRVLATLNPRGGACTGRLRPGLAGYFRFPAGLDLHLVSVHLKSGPDPRSFELRRRAIAGLGSALQELSAAHADADVVVAGDFNTMGCETCSPASDSAQELALLAGELEALPQALNIIGGDLGCSTYHKGHARSLDHFAVARATAELDPSSRVRASGYCGSSACGPLRARTMPLAHRRLSDHCPLVLDIADVDRD